MQIAASGSPMPRWDPRSGGGNAKDETKVSLSPLWGRLWGWKGHRDRPQSRAQGLWVRWGGMLGMGEFPSGCASPPLFP